MKPEDVHKSGPILSMNSVEVLYNSVMLAIKGVSIEVPHLLRSGVRGDVVVGGGDAQQLVAHAPAGPVGHEPGRLQSANHVDGEVAFGHG